MLKRFYQIDDIPLLEWKCLDSTLPSIGPRIALCDQYSDVHIHRIIFVKRNVFQWEQTYFW